MAAVEHQHGGAGALIFALHDHQVFVSRRRIRRPGRRLGCGAARLSAALARLALHRVQQRAGRVEVERVAELVRLRRAGRLDAGRLLARVVAAVAALAERAEQIAQRAVAEEVERLVGDFEGAPAAGRARCRRCPARRCALGFEVGRRRDVALLAHPLDDLLDQLLELRSRVVLIAVGRIAEQPLDRFLRQHAAVEQRIEDRIVQRLHRPVRRRRSPYGLPKPLDSSRSDSFDDQILEIELVEQVAGELGVAVFH